MENLTKKTHFVENYLTKNTHFVENLTKTKNYKKKIIKKKLIIKKIKTFNKKNKKYLLIYKNI